MIPATIARDMRLGVTLSVLGGATARYKPINPLAYDKYPKDRNTQSAQSATQ